MYSTTKAFLYIYVGRYIEIVLFYLNPASGTVSMCVHVSVCVCTSMSVHVRVCVCWGGGELSTAIDAGDAGVSGMLPGRSCRQARTYTV